MSNKFLASISFFCFLFIQSSQAQEIEDLSFYESLPFYKNKKQTEWVDSLYNSLSLDQKIGQLFMVAAYSNKGEAHENSIRKLIKDEEIGGIIFMQDQAKRQIMLTNSYQSLSKVPLLIAMDAEWGVGMRLKKVKNLPWAMTLGAVKDDKLAYEYGNEVARQIKRLGAHVNFGPVVDVNTNPNNPIIGNRSFGSTVENVARKGIAYSNGMQNKDVLACAKHFPGHGDTSSDSHKTLPSVLHKEDRLKNIELTPFKKMIDNDVAMIMVAHLNVPNLEPDNRIPSSLSYKIVTEKLKKDMGFKGLIVTDALNMKGVTNSFPNGETDLRAFKAGNDILLFSQAVGIAKEKIKVALQKGEVPLNRLEESVKKILMAKYSVGLNKVSKVSEQDVLKDLNAGVGSFNRKIAEEAITVIKNQENFLPIKNTYRKKIAYVKFGDSNASPFLNQLKKHGEVKQVFVSSKTQIKNLASYDYVIMGIHKSDSSPFKSYKISSAEKILIDEISKIKTSVLCVFTSPYGLRGINTSRLKAIVLGYQNSIEEQTKLPEIIFGALSAKGKLPASINSEFQAGIGTVFPHQQIIGFAEPEEVGMSLEKLHELDVIAENAISLGVSPSIEVLVARHGKIVYEKSFGHPTYNSPKEVDANTIYDIASVTKITATLPMVMKAVGDEKLDVNQNLGNVLPQVKGTNKSDLTIKNILGHQAGLEPWIAFHKEAVDIKNGKPYLDYFSRTPNATFPIEITPNLFLRKSFSDSIQKIIFKSKLRAKSYKYSDLGFYLLKYVVEYQYGKRLDTLATEYFYKPLNMSRTTFNAYKHFSLNEIAPTEKDDFFRKRLVHGQVHDQGAALLEGVGGHAGLFSTTRDLAKMMQMFLNGGYYNGQKLLEPEVLKEFTRYQFKANGSRRGLGFDKQQLKGEGPTCGCTTSKSFGHQGFTGTIVWADPGEDLIYIFLSNRVYPKANNNKINKLDTRERIQKVIYDAIVEKMSV